MGRLQHLLKLRRFVHWRAIKWNRRAARNSALWVTHD
jgi:hypothetical protein